MNPVLWFWLSTAILAALLFLPISRIVWVLSVRRLQARLGSDLSPVELAGQLRRARFVSFFFSPAFSLFFCLNLLGNPFHG